MKKPGICVDVIVIDKNNNILLLKRKKDDSLFPGQFCFPGGHVDEGEDLYNAALRELDEETGIFANNLHKIGSYDYGNGYSTTLFAGFESKEDIDLSKIQLSIKEHDSYEWVHANDILDMDLAGDMKDMINYLLLDIEE